MSLIYCTKCGHRVSTTALKCPSCGTPPQMSNASGSPPAKANSPSVAHQEASPKASSVEADRTADPAGASTLATPGLPRWILASIFGLGLVFTLSFVNNFREAFAVMAGIAVLLLTFVPSITRMLERNRLSVRTVRWTCGVVFLAFFGIVSRMMPGRGSEISRSSTSTHVSAKAAVEEYAKNLISIERTVSEKMEEVLTRCDPGAIPESSADACREAYKAARAEVADDLEWISQNVEATHCLVSKSYFQNALRVYETAFNMPTNAFASIKESGDELLLRADERLRGEIGQCRYFAEREDRSGQTLEDVTPGTTNEQTKSGTHADVTDLENATEDGVAAGVRWSELVDAGSYDDAWATSADEIKTIGPEEAFAKMMKQTRAPLGKEVSRTVKDKGYAKDPQNAPRGEYVQMHFTTSFENAKSATELVIVKKQPDGVWKVGQYSIAPD